MKLVLRIATVVLLVAGTIWLVWLTRDNRALSVDVEQLESELGRMSIEDEDRIYLVAIEHPKVAPEVRGHVDKVWQFRCYLPPGYDFRRYRVSNRVGAGVYFEGGSGSSWSTPKSDPYHEVLTISMTKKDEHFECYFAFSGSGGTSFWERGGVATSDALVVETLVAPGEPARSFSQDAILPLIKIFDPSAPKSKVIDGKEMHSFPGAMFLFCPTARSGDLEILRRGGVPKGFKPEWVAEGKTHG